jgi:hypothetical protein
MTPRHRYGAAIRTVLGTLLFSLGVPPPVCAPRSARWTSSSAPFSSMTTVGHRGAAAEMPRHLGPHGGLEKKQLMHVAWKRAILGQPHAPNKD